MTPRFGSGRESAGWRLKKSPKRRANHYLRRREWTERTSASRTHLGTERTNASAAVSLHLEDSFGDRRNHLLELLLPAVSRSHSQPADHRVSHPPATPYSRQAADRLGRLAGTSQPCGLGLRTTTARTPMGGISTRLCPGTESDPIHLGTPEAARGRQSLSQEPGRAESARHPRPETHASPPNPDHGLLATS